MLSFVRMCAFRLLRDWSMTDHRGDTVLFTSASAAALSWKSRLLRDWSMTDHRGDTVLFTCTSAAALSWKSRGNAEFT